MFLQSVKDIHCLFKCGFITCSPAVFGKGINEESICVNLFPGVSGSAVKIDAHIGAAILPVDEMGHDVIVCPPGYPQAGSVAQHPVSR